MAALRDADPADRAAVARRGAEGGGRDGRRRLRQPLHLPDAAAPRRAPITVVILIQTIFLLSVYAEILVTTNGGPGYARPTCPSWSTRRPCSQFDIGQASAGGIIAVILANIVAFFADARGRQEPRRLRSMTWHAQSRHEDSDRHRRRLDRRLPDLLPDPLHDHHQLQDRSTEAIAGFSLIPSGHARELSARCRRSAAISSFFLNSVITVGRLDRCWR